MDQQSKETPNLPKGKVRVCALIPEILNKNIEVCCVKTGTTKQDFVIAALRQYLKQNAMDPDKMPKVEVSY